jgi:hypothetical protein
VTEQNRELLLKRVGQGQRSRREKEMDKTNRIAHQKEERQGDCGLLDLVAAHTDQW